MENKEEILRQRAKRTSGKKNNTGPDNAGKISVLQFSLYPETLAISDTYVSEVFSLTEITVIPGTPAFVMGVVNRRGRVICIINLKQILNIKTEGLTEMNKIICLKKGNTEFGIVTDSLLGVKMIDKTDINKGTLLNTDKFNLIEGITPDGIVILNDLNILNSKALIVG